MRPAGQGEERVDLEKAVRLLLDHSREMEEKEICQVFDCSGRVLAEDVAAPFDQPPFDRSPVDGYACRSQDIRLASQDNPVFLEVLEEIDAGSVPSRPVGPGQAARIMTGAPIPSGADCCIYQEKTDLGERRVAVYEGCKRHGNYCFQGEDICAGTLVLRKGTRLSYVEAGILAGLGRQKLWVYRRVRAAVFATGDELSEPGQPLAPGKIYDNNRYFLTVRLKELGIQTVESRRIPDDEDQMAAALLEASAKTDLVITTGGVSVGRRDIMHQALSRAGARRLFWKIRMKPGMPTIGSLIEGCPVVSLSGNPFGALADFELLVRPVLAKMSRDASLAPGVGEAVLTQGFQKPSPSRRFLRGRLEDGRVWIPEVKMHASGILSSMAGCNCLVDIPAGTECIEPGGMVRVLLIGSGAKA